MKAKPIAVAALFVSLLNAASVGLFVYVENQRLNVVDSYQARRLAVCESRMARVRAMVDFDTLHGYSDEVGWLRVSFDHTEFLKELGEGEGSRKR